MTIQEAELRIKQIQISRSAVTRPLETNSPNRGEFIALRRQRLASPHPLGSMPLIVLGRNQDETRQKDLQALASLSTAGKLVIAENSGHAIHLYWPDLVVQSIRQVLSAARREKGRRRDR